MLKFRFWGFWRFLRNQKSSPCCKVTFLRSWVVFAYLAKCIGNPIVKKMAWKNADFPFFGPPDGPMNSKITPDLDIDKLNFSFFAVFWGSDGPIFAIFWKKGRNWPFRPPEDDKKWNFQKSSSQLYRTYQYQDLGWFLSSLDHLVTQKRNISIFSSYFLNYGISYTYR